MMGVSFFDPEYQIDRVNCRHALLDSSRPCSRMACIFAAMSCGRTRPMVERTTMAIVLSSRANSSFSFTAKVEGNVMSQSDMMLQKAENASNEKPTKHFPQMCNQLAMYTAIFHENQEDFFQRGEVSDSTGLHGSAPMEDKQEQRNRQFDSVIRRRNVREKA